MEEEKNAAKEAFDATTFAQFLFGPRRRQTGAIFLAFVVVGAGTAEFPSGGIMI